jgi:hypothetical protein
MKFRLFFTYIFIELIATYNQSTNDCYAKNEIQTTGMSSIHCVHACLFLFNGECPIKN